LSRCYVTGNGVLGGGVSEADLDGGPTVLTSPIMNFSGIDGLISYKRWFFTNTDNDSLVVQISNNNGGSWTTVETVTRKGGGWISNTFRISDFVDPSTQVRVRFSVSDQPNDSVTEAGIDSFVASAIECAAGPAANVTMRNGSGVNVQCYSSLSLPVLGTSWNTLISHAHHPGARATIITARLLPGTGPMTRYGQVLVNLSSPLLFEHVIGSTGTADPHSLSIPNDPAMAGLTACTQAIIVGGGVELCNALDATAGY
jgi:hypothetical protein